MALQEFRLLSGDSIEFGNVLKLMSAQSIQIQQTYKLICTICADLNITNNLNFQEFLVHFHQFTINQASSEGFSKVMDYIQVYNYILIEKLLDDEVFSATEQLEMSVAYLEIVSREHKTRTNPQIVLLNKNICLLEELQLKIIGILEQLLSVFRSTQLEN